MISVSPLYAQLRAAFNEAKQKAFLDEYSRIGSAAVKSTIEPCIKVGVAFHHAGRLTWRI
jgi:replicative superfamily II helicase